MVAPQLNRRSFFRKKNSSAAGKISPSVFDLEHKTNFFLILYKIISGSIKGNWKILFFVIMVRDWTKRIMNFKVVAIPCFVQSRTILTKNFLISSCTSQDNLIYN